jgi:hypothetical protein
MFSATYNLPPSAAILSPLGAAPAIGIVPSAMNEPSACGQNV